MSYLKCPKCGSKGIHPAPGDRQCRYCGHWLLDKECKDCGDRIDYHKSQKELYFGSSHDDRCGTCRRMRRKLLEFCRRNHGYDFYGKKLINWDPRYHHCSTCAEMTPLDRLAVIR